MSVKIITLDQIKKIINQIDLIKSIEDGFIAYSQGKVVIPPVGELLFENPPGDVHIKYGNIRDDDFYVIKIASSFYENIKIGLSNSNGMMLIFNQKTGELLSVLLDEGYLTDVRTAVAGAIAAKYLAPKNVKRIGIFGAGVQGKLQLFYLKSVIDCKDAIIWGTNPEELSLYEKNVKEFGFNIETTTNLEDITSSCNLIVTATPSKAPLFNADMVQKGSHITAMGSDTTEKIELDPKLLNKSDIVVADSKTQCLTRGEIYQAIKAIDFDISNVFELGNVIDKKELQRTSDDQITIADLTGVAIQDIQISKAVYNALKE
jgi:ornithine cyclodeaminase